MKQFLLLFFRQSHLVYFHLFDIDFPDFDVDYPDSDFEAEFFWESAGECEIIDYECPCAEWWNKE